MRAALRIVKPDDKQTERQRLEASLRARIRNRDRLARLLDDEDAAIALDARSWADEQGEYRRPHLHEIRRRLMGNGNA
jgi:hypothetical protein